MLALSFVHFPHCFNIFAMGIYYFNKNSCLHSTHTIMQICKTCVVSFFLCNMLNCASGDAIRVGSVEQRNGNPVHQTQYMGLPWFAWPYLPLPPGRMFNGSSQPLLPLPHLLTLPAISAFPKVRVPANAPVACHGRSYSSSGDQIWFNKSNEDSGSSSHFQTQIKGIFLLTAL